MWVGLNLSDGSFFQAGTASRFGGCPSTQQLVFVQGFNPSGTLTLNMFQHCGLAQNPWNTFSVQRDAAYPDGSYDWLAYMNGTPLAGSRFNAHASDSGTNRPGAIAELSSPSGLPSTSDQLGPEGFNNLGSIFSGNLYPSYSAAWYRTNADCPRFNSHFNSGYFISTGTGLSPSYSCVAAGAKAW